MFAKQTKVKKYEKCSFKGDDPPKFQETKINYHSFLQRN